MFGIITMTDTVRVPAHLLHWPIQQALAGQIELKYVNKIVPQIGLCVAQPAHDGDDRRGVMIAVLSHGKTCGGDGDGGAIHVACRFDLLCWMPQPQHVLDGRIVRSTPAGLQIALGTFFADVYVPASFMLHPSQYDARTGLWVWEPVYEDDDDDDDDDQPKLPERYVMELGATMRCKIVRVEYCRVTHTAKGRTATTATSSSDHNGAAGNADDQLRHHDDNNHPDRAINMSPPRLPPRRLQRRQRSSSVSLPAQDVVTPASMTIVASVCEDGLGLTSWWGIGAEDDHDANMDAELDAATATAETTPLKMESNKAAPSSPAATTKMPPPPVPVTTGQLYANGTNQTATINHNNGDSSVVVVVKQENDLDMMVDPQLPVPDPPSLPPPFQPVTRRSSRRSSNTVANGHG